MIIALVVVVVGTIAACSGFVACFTPELWEWLRRKIDLTENGREPGVQVSDGVRTFGSRVSGFVIFSVGCWLAYVGGSTTYRLVTGQATFHALSRTAETPSTKGIPPALNALAVVVTIAGLLMAVFPSRALPLIVHLWPGGKTMPPNTNPTIKILVRSAGVFFAFVAFKFLVG